MEAKAFTIEVSHQGDMVFSIDIRGHDLVADQPEQGGGEDRGPMPTELLVASLAVSVAFHGRGFLHRRGLGDAVEVSACWWAELGPARVARVELRVYAPSLPVHLKDEFQTVVENCTVRNALLNPPEVLIEVLLESRQPAAIR